MTLPLMLPQPRLHDMQSGSCIIYDVQAAIQTRISQTSPSGKVTWRVSKFEPEPMSLWEGLPTLPHAALPRMELTGP